MPQEHAHVLKAVTKQHLCVETSEESLDSRRRIIECFYCSMMISCEPFCHFLPKKKRYFASNGGRKHGYTSMELWKQQVIPTFS